MMHQKNIFVTAIGTGCGKTVCAALLTEALEADYWKPVQSGDEEIDRKTVEQLISNPKTTLHKERYLFKMPVSPHMAAAFENTHIALTDFELPEYTNKFLVIEGAGGVLVPLNEKGLFVIDLAKKFEADIVLVSSYYLGSINHTLLTVEALQKRKLAVLGIVFNGTPNEYSKQVILKETGLKEIFHLPHLEVLHKEEIRKQAALLRTHLKEFVQI